MRTPRPGGRWTRQRQTTRAAYVRYIASRAWLSRRSWWFAEHRRRTGFPAGCAVCGSAENLELHHHEYSRIGHERFDDLTALCPVDHRRVHDIYDASRQWRTLGRAAASAGIIAALRRA